MPFDSREIAIRVRAFLAESSPALAGLPIPRIAAMLPPALESYLRSLYNDGNKRQQLMKKVTATAVNGEVDLTPLLDGATTRIFLPDIRRVTVFLASTKKPFTWVGNREQLDFARIGSNESPAIFLDGAILYTRNNADGLTDSLNEAVFFTVAVFPATFAAIPVSLQMDFLAYAVDFIKEKFALVKGVI